MRVTLLCLMGTTLLLPSCASTRRQSAARVGTESLAPVPEMPSTLKTPLPQLTPYPQSPPARPGASSSNRPPSGGPVTRPSGSGPMLQLPEGAMLETPGASGIQLAGATDDQIQPVTLLLAGKPAGGKQRHSLMHEPMWKKLHESTEQRPISSLVLGTGEYRVAVLGSLHGDEQQSEFLVDHLARHVLQHRDEFSGATYLFIRNPNPDGLHVRSAYNVRGVDLNRNFPSANWRPLTSGRAGERAASEVETRVVMRLLGDFRPDLVVHLKESSGTSFLNYEGAAQAQAELVTQYGSYRVEKNLGARASGSVENYATSKLKCASLTLLLKPDATEEETWSKNGRSLVAALTPVREPQRDSILGDSDPFDTLVTSEPRKASETSTVKYRGSMSEFPAPVPEHGYLELPPPPPRKFKN